MRDLFDDFMDELRKREAAARGEDPGPGRQRPPDPDDDGDDHDRPDDTDDDSGESGSGPSDDDAADTADDDAGGDRPETITAARRRRGRRRRGPGGPDDGAGNRAARAGRRLGIALLILALLGVFLLFSVGIDLWTDVLWYASVGFDPVFWTRLTATVGLGVGAFLVALIVLLGNLWLAGRLSPPPSEGGGTFRSLFDRLNEAAQAADSRRDSTRSPFGGGRDPFGNVRSTGSPIVFETTDIPDLRPLAGWILGALALFFAIIIGGSVSGAWETVLLWIHRVPFSPTASVTDPIFHRDISFFLFELPFLRLVQGVFNGIVIAALLLSLTRYIVSASSGGLVFSSPVRVHLAVLGGLFLLSVAFGYQLDKLDLSYSTRGVAAGVSYTDQNAQFLAFDVLTVISGIAAALLVGAAFTRMLWPLGLTIAVWFVASLVIGRLYPEAIQRLTVTPNQYAQESPYIGNNIAMTQLAFDVGTWTDDVPFNGTAVLTPDQVARESSTFASARLWDYRARSRRASTSSRPCASTTTSPTSTPTATRSAGSSARSCSRAGSSRSSRTHRRPAGSTSGSCTPTASASRWSRSTRSAPGPAEPVHRRTCRRSRPRAPRPSPSRGSTSASGLRRTSSPAPRKTSSTIRPARPTPVARSAPRPAGPARPGSSSTRP